MKRILILTCLGLLAGCNVYVTPAPVPELEVRSATYGTNYRDPNTGASYICDNRPTTLTYRFIYQGELRSWTSYLEGRELEEIKGRRTFTPSSQGVVAFEEQGYEVQYVMSPNFAPYQQGDNQQENAQVSPQAIDVVPVPQPTPIGASRIHLILEGADGKAKPYVSRDIPVIINCP